MRWVIGAIGAVVPYPLAEEPEPVVAGAGPGAYSIVLATGDPYWSGNLVARVAAPVVVEWETAWIRAVAAPGFPVPELVVDGHDLGVAVFRTPPGTNLAACMAADFGHMPQHLALLGRLHARLHAFPIRGDDARPSSFRSFGWYGAATEEERWLAAQRPDPGAGAKVVCHGELYPTNVYLDGEVDGDTDLKVVAVNWTKACVSSPAYDVASTLVAFWALPLYVDNAIQRKMIKMARDSLATAYLDAYRAAAPLPLDEDALRYWQASHLWQLAAEVNRRLDGEAISPWSPAATIADPAKALGDIRTHFWSLTEG